MDCERNHQGSLTDGPPGQLDIYSSIMEAPACYMQFCRQASTIWSSMKRDSGQNSRRKPRSNCRRSRLISSMWPVCQDISAHSSLNSKCKWFNSLEGLISRETNLILESNRANANSWITRRLLYWSTIRSTLSSRWKLRERRIKDSIAFVFREKYLVNGKAF